MGKRKGVVPVTDGNLWAVIDLATAEDQVVFDGECMLVAVHVNVTLSAHPVNIKSGATTAIVLPASRAAGNHTALNNMEMLEGITVSRTNAAATGDITVVYQPYN